MSVKNNDKWMYGEFVRKRWGVSKETLEAFVIDNGLPIYGFNGEIENFEDGLPGFIDTYKFKLDDIEKFESEYDHMLDIDKYYLEIALNAKEKRELGQLKRQKEYWDSAIEIAVKIGMFCQEQNDKVFIRDDIEKQVFMIDKDLPYTAFEKIWKAIPEQFRSKGGRPKKDKN
jgi:hypothetical protein